MFFSLQVSRPPGPCGSELMGDACFSPSISLRAPLASLNTHWASTHAPAIHQTSFCLFSELRKSYLIASRLHRGADSTPAVCGRERQACACVWFTCQSRPSTPELKGTLMRPRTEITADVMCFGTEKPHESDGLKNIRPLLKHHRYQSDINTTRDRYWDDSFILSNDSFWNTTMHVYTHLKCVFFHELVLDSVGLNESLWREDESETFMRTQDLLNTCNGFIVVKPKRFLACRWY